MTRFVSFLLVTALAFCALHWVRLELIEAANEERQWQSLMDNASHAAKTWRIRP